MEIIVKIAYVRCVLIYVVYIWYKLTDEKPYVIPVLITNYKRFLPIYQQYCSFLALYVNICTVA